MTVFVTGAAGFIGSHLTERLLGTTDEQVVGIDNFDPFYARAIKERNLATARVSRRFTLHEVDLLRDAVKLGELYAHYRPTTVFHLAARAGVRSSIADPKGYADVNIGTTTNLLTLAARHATQCFVLASSSSVYGNNANVPFAEADATDAPISPYAATKKACELLCHTFHHLHGLSVASLRLFTVYGPRQRPDLAIHKFARAIIDGRPITMYGSGDTSRDYTFIDDIIDGIVSAAAHIAKTTTSALFNLGNSAPVRLADLVTMLETAIGTHARIERTTMQAGDVVRTYADIAHARHTLGYSPRTDIAGGIERFVRWLREQ
jgi:UDP-glucuronate 4-epimerase